MDEMQAAGGGQPDGTSAAADTDPLVAVRAQLETVLELPLDERAAVFEDAHRAVVAELRALELG